MEPTAHRLTCNGPSLQKGARMERAWSCLCGATFFGFDGAVRKAFADHKAGA